MNILNPRLIYFCHDHLAERSPDPAFVQSVCILYARRGSAGRHCVRSSRTQARLRGGHTTHTATRNSEGTNCMNIHLEPEASGPPLSCRQHGGMRSLTRDASHRSQSLWAVCPTPQFGLHVTCACEVTNTSPFVLSRLRHSLPSHVHSHQRREGAVRGASECRH